jgi:hypothetical protein
MRNKVQKKFALIAPNAILLQDFTFPENCYKDFIY